MWTPPNHISGADGRYGGAGGANAPVDASLKCGTTLCAAAGPGHAAAKRSASRESGRFVTGTVLVYLSRPSTKRGGTFGADLVSRVCE